MRSAILLAVPLLAFLIVAGGSFADYRHYSTIAGAQGRYIYHGIVVLAALSAIGWARLIGPRVGAWVIPAVVLAALVTEAGAWGGILLTWYAPDRPGSLSRMTEGVSSLLRWSPLPVPLTVLFTAVLPVLAGLSMIAMLIHGARCIGGDGPC